MVVVLVMLYPALLAGKEESLRNSTLGMRNANQVIRKRTLLHTLQEREFVLRHGEEVQGVKG